MYIHPTILHYSPVSFPFLTCFACGSERCNALILSTNSALAMATIFRRPPLPLKPKHGAGGQEETRGTSWTLGQQLGEKKNGNLGNGQLGGFLSHGGGIPKSSILDFPLYTIRFWGPQFMETPFGFLEDSVPVRPLGCDLLYATGHEQLWKGNGKHLNWTVVSQESSRQVHLCTRRVGLANLALSNHA